MGALAEHSFRPLNAGGDIAARSHLPTVLSLRVRPGSGILGGVSVLFGSGSGHPAKRRAASVLRRGALLGLVWLALPGPAGAEPRMLTNAWSYVLHYPCDSSPAVGDDGTIYLGVWNGDFRAFRPDGSPKWVFHAGREIKSSPAIGSDGTLYFGSRDHNFYAVGPDGKEKWRFKTGAWVDSSPALGVDGTIYFGSWDKTFYAVNLDGSKKWEFKTAGEVVSSPAIGAGGEIYFGSHDGRFYALSPKGNQAWEYTTGGPIISSPAIDQDATLYFSSVDGFFYALHPDGALKWRLKTGGITESSPVIGQDGTIYVGANTALWAISPEGRKKWEQPYAQLIETAPLALADGSVCCVARDGMLVNLDAPNHFNWTYWQNWCGSLSPTAATNGVIYTTGNVMGTGIIFYALQADVGLARSPWPKFRATLRNTGNQTERAAP